MMCAIGVGITPRQYLVHRRSPVFPRPDCRRKCREIDVEGGWSTVGRGLVAAYNGEFKIHPGQMYAVEIHDGRIEIAAYWLQGKDSNDGARPYRLSTVRRLIAIDQQERIWRGMTYADMAAKVRKIYPHIYIPSPEEFFGAYGIAYDVKECKPINDGRFVDEPEVMSHTRNVG